MSSNNNPPHIGKEAVVIGDPGGAVGEGAVVIRPTDPRGNIRIEGTVAAGRGAVAGPGGIAIGANAVAGPVDLSALAELRKLVAANSPTLLPVVEELEIELRKPEKNRSRIRELWEAVEVAVTAAGAYDLATKISVLISALIGSAA